MVIRKSNLFIVSLLSLFLLGACSDESVATKDVQPTAVEQKLENEFETAVKVKNAEFEQNPINLTSYAEDVGAKLIQPTMESFAVNESVTIEGTIEQHEQLKENYVWIKINFNGDTLSSNSLEYYTPIIDGKFKQETTLFNGEGDYYVTVLLPSKDQDNYYYDLTSFNVFNVNPTIHRDITYNPSALNANLAIQDPESGYVKRNEVFKLKGKVDTIEDLKEIMIELKKDGETWKHVIPVKNGQFTYDIPLFYGKGVHELKVYIPDKERDGYFQESTALYIDNESDFIAKPITYTKEYEERGINLESPTFGGEETDLTYHLKGTIDKIAPFAKDTTHLYVTTKKDGEEALDVIPVKDYTFDDDFYLRFGPGSYEVTVSVPEIKEENSSKFYYFGVAQFQVENTATEDLRDLLPSRGVQSESPEIIAIANDLIKETMSDREKAKAVYEYTAKTISYDVKKLENDEFDWDDSALKVLNLKTGVCQDYAYLAIALLRAGDMEARFVTGHAGAGFNRARHAWVEVMVDGEWLTMDPTWGSGYIDKDKFVANYTEDYFDPTEKAFESHFRFGVEY